ncbi:MAG: hypothetical protein M3436_11170, partial [Pseudomonadota bacterium]|nr:hypothetical protein [Pseudomonadota bacterium]
PYNFGKILTNVSEASPELQFSLAYSEILVGGLTESVASKHEGHYFPVQRSLQTRFRALGSQN